LIIIYYNSIVLPVIETEALGDLQIQNRGESKGTSFSSFHSFYHYHRYLSNHWYSLVLEFDQNKNAFSQMSPTLLNYYFWEPQWCYKHTSSNSIKDRAICGIVHLHTDQLPPISLLKKETLVTHFLSCIMAYNIGNAILQVSPSKSNRI